MGVGRLLVMVDPSASGFLVRLSQCGYMSYTEQAALDAIRAAMAVDADALAEQLAANARTTAGGAHIRGTQIVRVPRDS